MREEVMRNLETPETGVKVITLRLPVATWAALNSAKDRNRRSLHGEILTALEEYLRRTTPASKKEAK